MPAINRKLDDGESQAEPLAIVIQRLARARITGALAHSSKAGQQPDQEPVFRAFLIDVRDAEESRILL